MAWAIQLFSRAAFERWPMAWAIQFGYSVVCCLVSGLFVLSDGCLVQILSRGHIHRGTLKATGSLSVGEAACHLKEVSQP